MLDDLTYTEKNIQNALYNDCLSRGHRLVAINCSVLGNESDLLSMGKAGYLNEYEIKVSRSDFRVDIKKHRHEQYLELAAGIEIDYCERYAPKYFYYVVPEGLVHPHEVPEYAGLIYVKWRKNAESYSIWVKDVKPATKLHNNKAEVEHIIQMGRNSMYKYWEPRRFSHYVSI